MKFAYGFAATGVGFAALLCATAPLPAQSASEGARAFVEKSEQALERTSSAAAALSAKASEAVAEAVTAATEIEVTFAEEGPLGISFGTVGTSGGDDEGGNPKVVIGLEEEGCAARMESCPIEVGMVIIRVQDVACEALTFAATLDLIRMASRPLTLTVRSPPAALSPRRAPPHPCVRGVQFKRPHLFEKRPEWLDSTDWDAALDITDGKSDSVGPPQSAESAEAEVSLSDRFYHRRPSSAEPDIAKFYGPNVFDRTRATARDVGLPPIAAESEPESEPEPEPTDSACASGDRSVFSRAGGRSPVEARAGAGARSRDGGAPSGWLGGTYRPRWQDVLRRPHGELRR